MKLLLDTHTFLWATTGDTRRLSKVAIEALGDVEHELLLSAVSVAEIAIKARIGKLRLDRAPIDFVEHYGAQMSICHLPLTAAQAGRVFALAVGHQDPFDHLLIAQALEEELPIVTADKHFKRYGVRVIW